MKRVDREDSGRRRALRCWASIVSSLLLLHTSGCASWAAMSMPGPATDHLVEIDMQRSDVEGHLRAVPTTMYEHRGIREARYDYSDGPPGWAKIRIILYVGLDVFTLGLAELITWPIETEARDRIQRVAVAEYDPDDALIAWRVRKRIGGETIASQRSADYEQIIADVRREIEERQAALAAAMGSHALTAPSRMTLDEIPPDLVLGRTYALVIGNNDYVSLPPLRTARKDAEDVAGLLSEKYGYEVELLTDATRGDILRAIQRYRDELAADDNLLIYYAGHGIRDESQDHGYWLPVDAVAKDSTQWIANAEITRQLRAMASRHVLVIADSCYSGMLMRGIAVPDRAPDYLRRLAAYRSRTAFTSGGIEPVADAGFDGNSVFAAALLDELDANDGLIAASELFVSVRRRVTLNSDQTPHYAPILRAGHEDGDFLFALPWGPGSQSGVRQIPVD